MKKPRHLSPEDRAVWETVARRVKPLHSRATAVAPEAKRKPMKSAPFTADPIPDFRIGSGAKLRSAHDTLPPLADRLRAKPVSMDARQFNRMGRGKLKPEGRIDLHGMTMNEAHPELTHFILNAVDRGKRLVLVITGKGKDRDDGAPIPMRHGVLRHQVPQWLALPPLSVHILEVRPAHRRHGGDGAYYVYLRRNR